MNTLRPGWSKNTSQTTRLLDRFLIAVWRLGLGPWLNLSPKALGRHMVIVQRNRTTGQRSYTPLHYAEVDGEIYCIAPAGTANDWRPSLSEKQEVDVWLPDGWWTGLAETLRPNRANLPLLRQVLLASGPAGLLRSRIHPKNISAVQLARAAGWNGAFSSQPAAVSQPASPAWRLLHIQRQAARTGAGGPGDMAWFWPLAALLLLPFSWRRKK